MADVHDVMALVNMAEARERLDPANAHARYETAERMLDQHLAGFGLTRDDDSGIVDVYMPLYTRIMGGYRRLVAAREPGI